MISFTAWSGRPMIGEIVLRPAAGFQFLTNVYAGLKRLGRAKRLIAVHGGSLKACSMIIDQLDDHDSFDWRALKADDQPELIVETDGMLASSFAR
jgi:hypothetical protein